MSTKIEWTDETWNPIIGCSHCSPGCDHCYAERMAFRLAHMDIESPYNEVVRHDQWGQLMSGWNGSTELVESALDKPLRWRKPRRVFVCSMGDLFHESVPDAWVLRVFETIAVCPQHTFQLLTKRPERMRAFLSLCEDWYSPEWPHVWLGVTVCNQEEADEKIPALLEIPAAVRFVSIEPMLGPVRLQLLSRPWCDDCHGTGWYGDNGPGIKGNREYVHCDCHDRRKIDWVIVGGETGPGARLMHPRWARQVLDQCHQANVPFFFKQWGPKRAGRLLDGREWNEMPTERR